MPRINFVIVLVISFVVFGFTNAGVKQDHPLDIVFCVDLSGSTNGIVDEFRENYSHIVNQLTTLQPKPDIRVGLVAFSRKSYGKKNAYVKIISPLSDDLDKINREFWKMQRSIEHGDQFVAAAMTKAIDGLNWTKDPNGLKLMYLVGNGIVNLGTTSYTEVSERAAEENIIINTVYCKPSNILKELSGWRRIANIADGKQYEIEIGKKAKEFETDIDLKEVADLNRKLNHTYIGHGEYGRDNVEVLKKNGRHIELTSTVTFLARMYFKLSDEFYGCQQSWDLVDWTLAGNNDFNLIDRKSLLKEYRTSTNAELEYLVYKKKVERKRLIKELKLILTPEVLDEINDFIVNDNTDNEKFEKVFCNSLLEFSTKEGFTASLSGK